MTRKLILLVTALLAVSVTGCASLTASMAPKPPQFVEIVNPKSVQVIVPNDKDIVSTVFTSADFTGDVWGVRYYRNDISERQLILIKNKTNNKFDLERRVDNGMSGSGIRYNIDYNINNRADNTVFEFKPVKYFKYTQGLLLPFPVPEFSEDDVVNYIIGQQVNYKIELNSEYNTESIFANFQRLANTETYKQGEKDPVTGKIFKNKFSIPVANGKITFSLETFPYRNGTKAVIYLNVPGYFTSQNKVDFNVILNDVKSRLQTIVNS